MALGRRVGQDCYLGRPSARQCLQSVTYRAVVPRSLCATRTSLIFILTIVWPYAAWSAVVSEVVSVPGPSVGSSGRGACILMSAHLLGWVDGLETGPRQVGDHLVLFQAVPAGGDRVRSGIALRGPVAWCSASIITAPAWSTTTMP